MNRKKLTDLSEMMNKQKWHIEIRSTIIQRTVCIVGNTKWISVSVSQTLAQPVYGGLTLFLLLDPNTKWNWCDGPFDSRYFRVAQFTFVVFVLIFLYIFLVVFLVFVIFVNSGHFLTTTILFNKSTNLCRILPHRMSSRWFLSIFVDRTGSSSVFLHIQPGAGNSHW